MTSVKLVSTGGRKVTPAGLQSQCSEISGCHDNVTVQECSKGQHTVMPAYDVADGSREFYPYTKDVVVSCLSGQRSILRQKVSL